MALNCNDDKSAIWIFRVLHRFEGWIAREDLLGYGYDIRSVRIDFGRRCDLIHFSLK